MTASQLPIILVADNIRSLYNVGALFRLADGLNIEALYLCGITGYPKLGTNQKDKRPEWMQERADKAIRKTGLSGVEAVTFRYFSTTGEALAALKAKGYQLIALELAEQSQDYRTASYRFPLGIVIGHETEGVEPTVLERVDQTVHLPMRGQGHSLNVATASAAFLYYLADQYEHLN